MKKITFSTLFIFFFFVNQVSAQLYLPVEQDINFGKTTAPAWVVSADDAPLNDLQKSWASYIKQELKVRSRKDGRDMLTAKAVVIPSIAEDMGDLRMKVFTEGDQSFIAVAFITGYSTAINTMDNPREADNLRKLTRNYVMQYKMSMLNEQIVQYKKQNKALLSDYERNGREQKKLRKQMARNEKELNADRGGKDKVFEMKNNKIANQSRLDALESIMINQRNKLAEFSFNIQKMESDISYLQSIFADPTAQH